MGFASLIIKFRPHVESNSWISSFRRAIVNRSADFSTDACVSSGSSPAHQTGFRGALRGEHLSIRVRSCHDPAPRAPSASRNTFSVSHDHGRQRSDKGPQHTFLPSRWPDCTLSRLRAEENDRPVTQSIATPGAVFVLKTIDTPRSDAGRPLEPWVCHHTREPTVLSRVSCRPFHPEFWPFFTSLACHLGALPGYLGPVGSPYTRGDHLPLWAAQFFLLCVLLEVFATPTRQYHDRTLIHPSSPACAPPQNQRCLHTRRFGTLASPPPPVNDLSWGPHLLCHRWLQWPGSTRRSSRQSVYLEGNGPLSGPFLFLQTDLSFELGIVDDSVQCWSNLRIEYFKMVFEFPLIEH